MQWLGRFLRLRAQDLDSADSAFWQQSVLRIIVLSGLCLVFAIVLHSSWQAWQIGAYHVIAITSSFYLALLSTLFISSRYVKRSAAALLAIVILAGLCILVLVDNFELGKLGIIFIYTLPMISLMFFGFRTALVFMALNFIPFVYLLQNQAPANFLGWSITLPASHSYLHGLLFLFFNLCLPLATARVFSTLKRSAVQLKDLNQHLAQSHDYYEELFEHNGSATVLVTASGDIIKCNSLASQLLGLDSEQQANLLSLLNFVQDGQLQGHWLKGKVECCLKSRPESSLVLKHVMLTRSGHHVVSLQEISALRQLQLQLKQSQKAQDSWLHYDALTCLPNVAGFTELVNYKQEQLAPHEFGLMAIIRLRHVKTLNQQYGYEFGSQLLQHFSKVAKAALPSDAVLARVRGVKFALWLKGDLNVLDPKQLAEAIASQLPVELTVGPYTARMNYQFGVSFTERHDNQNAQQLIEQCELALELSSPGQAVSFYDQQQAQQLEQDYQLLNAFRDAIRQKQLELWLQPKVDPQGKIQSFEALSRWFVDGQAIAPDCFVLMAERHGLMTMFSRLVLQQSVSILQSWQQQGLLYPIAINLGGPELLDDSFFAELMSLSADHAWLTRYLQLEITETNIAVQQPLLHKRLKALHQYGFSISIDDFGTGHSSLSQLVDCPADTIKIDRRFVSCIPQDSRTVRILHTTIQLAKALNLNIVAEGVENDIQRRFLQSLGCQLMQGYLFGRPAPALYWQNLLLPRLNSVTIPALQHQS
ncbi:EAL domain-containing protein [Rheinheimera sp. A13L]|uniref:GGDEF domain-containing phosphodiesterase n=1 Tax=Rheinheimera sp. A13L TaxID=506534 RepID=UPI0002125166|nr:GGDEF domain-containing phosphodiesterase [Rheinheimera sp. A13L]EGM79595.1 EAL domain-containing protein [Rheinheimera sp. A13L]